MTVTCVIVDDNALFLEGAADLLTREGVDVVGVASDSAAAIRLVAELRPDVTLVDIDLGDEDGFELAQRLDDISPLSRVILISTHAEDDLAHLHRRSRALGFIAKTRLSAQEIRERIVAPPNLDQRLDEPRVDYRSPCPNPAERVHEVVHVHDPALEQVADPLAGREKVCRVLDLDVSREDEDADLREFFADRVRGIEPFGGVRRRHADVDDHQIRLVLSHELDQRVSVAGLADDLEVGSLEEAREPFAQEDVVVRDDDATTDGHRRPHDLQPYAVTR